MLPDEPRQQHESAVLIQHRDRLSALLRKEPESQPVHRQHFHIEQTVSPKAFKGTLLGDQRILIRHNNKRLTRDIIVDETLLIYILSSCE